MISSARCNIYEVNAASVIALYGDFIEGGGRELSLVLASSSPTAPIRDAVEKSLNALGYGRGACAYVRLKTPDCGALGANDLRSIVEGLDPLTIVVCDAEAAQLLESAYRSPVAGDAAFRVLGRDVIAFGDLGALIATPEGKQRAWALLKKIPRLER